MNTFTISQLQDYSGIKAHTIRIWEQRYNALQPNRTEGNTRYYDGNQLRRLLNIVSLINSDHKVSQLCRMSDEELKLQLVEQYKTVDSKNKSALYTSQLIAAATEFDEAQFEKIFSSCVKYYGFKKTYVHIIYPTLNRLGLLWSQGSLTPAHEHFIVNLIRNKILLAISSLPPAKDEKDSWLLFLPEDEFHEIGLLMAYFTLRSAGKKVYYLGANVPLTSLLKTFKAIKPNKALVFLVSKNQKEKSIHALNTLAKDLKKISLYVASSWNKTDLQNKNSKAFIKLSTVAELEAQLA